MVLLITLISIGAFAWPKGSHKSDYGYSYKSSYKSSYHHRGTNTGVPGLSFSANRALGITRAKQNFARATGIPTTKQGRMAKFGRTIWNWIFGTSK